MTMLFFDRVPVAPLRGPDELLASGEYQHLYCNQLLLPSQLAKPVI